MDGSTRRRTVDTPSAARQCVRVPLPLVPATVHYAWIAAAPARPDRPTREVSGDSRATPASVRRRQERRGAGVGFRHPAAGAAGRARPQAVPDRRRRLGPAAVAPRWTGRPPPGSRPSPAGSPTMPTADAWNRGLAVLTASFNADLVVLAGFMKLVGPAFLAAFPDRVLNAHPSLLPAFPGHARPGGRARARGETHRLHRVPGRRRHRCRPDRGAARRAGAGRRRRRDPCTNGSRSPSAPCWSTWSPR